MEPIIEIRSIGKKYNIAHLRGGYVALRDVLSGIIHHPFSFIRAKAKSAIGRSTKEEFWALRDVSASIMPGEVVGIIGHNGAGKSTLLKILTGITPPTEGEIIVRGRVSSLLEVGTGFHPELTGRENIFLNGAILGMTRKEITNKFDEIVAFAGIEKFLDTPVKYYSSGMYVRLAFSVAAHMEPDILLVDEVLAVGDAEFQKKCLGKMQEVTSANGRTILFVSHNLGAVQSLCKKTIWLDHGRIKKIGETSEIIHEYSHARPAAKDASSHTLVLKSGAEVGTVRFTDIRLTDSEGHTLIPSDEKLKIQLDYDSDFKSALPDSRILITITSEFSQRVAYRLDSHVTARTLANNLPPRGAIICITDPINLAEGKYRVDIQFLSQEINSEKLAMTAEFDVITDHNRYGYLRPHDKKISDHLIRYSFTHAPPLP